jgi:DNA-binding response OmpR family regulator
MRALIVDSSHLDATYAAKLLQRHGFGTVVVTPPYDLSASSIEPCFDAFALDIAMDAGQAWSLLEQARHKCSEESVIVLTGLDVQPGLSVAALQLGADEVLQKPFHGEELLAVIDARLRRRASKAVRSITDGLVTDRDCKINGASSKFDKDMRIIHCEGV